MSRGPLPTGKARRRNAPSIPTTNLPVGGRKGRAPALPDGYELRTAGRAFWKWVWNTPQAAGWDSGALYAVARRAQLEDDLAVLDHFDPFDLAELLGMEEKEAVRHLEWVIGRLKGLAGGRLAVISRMGELDKRLGLDPKAMAELRWKVVDDQVDQKPSPTRSAAPLPENVRRLRVADPETAVG